MNDETRKMSETPRTDEALVNRANITQAGYFWWVHADFCRGLERELNLAKAELSKTRQALMDSLERDGV